MASLTDSQKICKVLFNIPNMVCHIRIITSLLAFYYFHTWPMMTIISYSISLNLDNVDGPCARYFGQSSKFGAVYDMIIDRMSTIIFMMHLATLFPNQTQWLAFLSILDFSSHWFQMYAAQISGFDSHKALADHSAVLKMYYGCDPVKFAFSFGFEMFLVCLYISCWGPQSALAVFSQDFMEFNKKALWYVAFPNFMGRQVIHPCN